MDIWTKVGMTVFGLFWVWMLYRDMKGNPERYSKKNFSKSVTTVGFLTLGLIAFVALLVLMVRN